MLLISPLPVCLILSRRLDNVDIDRFEAIDRTIILAICERATKSNNARHRQKVIYNAEGIVRRAELPSHRFILTSRKKKKKSLIPNSNNIIRFHITNIFFSRKTIKQLRIGHVTCSVFPLTRDDFGILSPKSLQQSTLLFNSFGMTLEIF